MAEEKNRPGMKEGGKEENRTDVELKIENSETEHPHAEEERPEHELQKARIAELETAVGQIKDQLLRKAAEFENYKRRTENEYADRMRCANEELLSELLPVMDDLDRFLKTSKGKHAGGRDEVFHRGMELIHQKLVKILGAQGMKHYEVVGKPFDAYYHDALTQMPKEDVPPHTVIEEVEKGYMLHDKVLRHAKVVVSSMDDEDPSKTVSEKMSETGGGEAGQSLPDSLSQNDSAGKDDTAKKNGRQG